MGSRSQDDSAFSYYLIDLPSLANYLSGIQGLVYKRGGALAGSVLRAPESRDNVVVWVCWIWCTLLLAGERSGGSNSHYGGTESGEEFPSRPFRGWATGKALGFRQKT
jgi:hypothetical protein